MFKEKTLWKGLGSKINFDNKPIVGIKSIFVKEYSGKLCLASHDDTQIIAEEEVIEVKKPEEHKVIKDIPIIIPENLKNYRVSY